MAEQHRLEQKYEELIEQRAAMKGMVNKSKYREIQEDIQDVSRSLRDSTNNLIRSLKDNPNVSGNLIKVQRDRTELYDIILRCIQELRDRGLFYTVSNKVDEENNARTRFQQLKTREKELRQAVTKLQETLSNEQKSFQRTSQEQTQAIATLKGELQKMKGSSSYDTKFKRLESAASVSAIYRESKHKQRKLEFRVKELEEKLQTEQLVNAQTKDFLIRKHSSLTEDIVKWDVKYEKDTGNLDNEIKKMVADRTQLLEKLTALQIRKNQEVRDELAKKAQEEMEVRKAIETKELLKLQNRAARAIQRQMRRYVKRKKELNAIKEELKRKKAAAKAKKAKANK